MLETTNDVHELDLLTDVPGPRRHPSGDPDRPAPDTGGHDSGPLRALVELVRSGAREDEVLEGVKQARAVGWSWTPIAIVLGTSRAAAIARFSRAVGHPVARRRTRLAG